nr:type I restriction-modification system subunit M N-terminal domain-containing protein [Sinisalibacter aestuarii]
MAFAADLFKAADKLRGSLEPSEYKHVALGLIFLKYISDAFEVLHAKLASINERSENRLGRFSFALRVTRIGESNGRGHDSHQNPTYVFQWVTEVLWSTIVTRHTDQRQSAKTGPDRRTVRLPRIAAMRPQQHRDNTPNVGFS